MKKFPIRIDKRILEEKILDCVAYIRQKPQMEAFRVLKLIVDRTSGLIK